MERKRSWILFDHALHASAFDFGCLMKSLIFSVTLSSTLLRLLEVHLVEKFISERKQYPVMWLTIFRRIDLVFSRLSLLLLSDGRDIFPNPLSFFCSFLFFLFFYVVKNHLLLLVASLIQRTLLGSRTVLFHPLRFLTCFSPAAQKM